jgi:hypothetical protein
MTESKNQFLSRKRIRNLNKKEQDERWKQHLASQRGGATNRKSARSRPVRAQYAPCTEMYANSLANPFDVHGACVPGFPALSSRKSSVFSRGVFFTGTTATNFGFVCLAPHSAVANDINALIYSTAAGTTSVVTNANANQFNSEYTASDFTTLQVASRVVSAGIRVRYIGTELNRSGYMIPLEEPDHNTIVGASIGTFLSYDRAKTVATTRDWVSVTWQPVKPADLEFSHNAHLTEPYHMGILIGGFSGATSGAYEYESYVNLEYIGADVRGKTSSSSDVQGMMTVVSALSQADSIYMDAAARGRTTGIDIVNAVNKGINLYESAKKGFDLLTQGYKAASFGMEAAALIM